MTNTVELLGTYGGDETHALSAWTSTYREVDTEKWLRMPDLLKYLAENKHHTPFEKSALHFLVTCDTASHIHFIKHRIGVSVNGESARYKEHTQDKYLIPEDWPESAKLALRDHATESFQKYHDYIAYLESCGVDRKRAKESARFFLPYNSQVTLDVQFNFRSFMHFVGLRYKPDAQKEIRELAGSMLDLVAQLPNEDFHYSLKAFGYV